MVRKETTRYSILGMLTRGPMSGYELKAEIDSSIGHFWQESFGQLYPVLRQLTAEGLVRSERSGPRRRTEYALTEEGRIALRAWLGLEVVSHNSQRSELLLKLFFGRHAAEGAVRAHLERHREALVEAREAYAFIERAVRGETDPDQPFWMVTIRYAIAVVDAGLRWVDEALEILATVAPAQEAMVRATFSDLSEQAIGKRAE